ncbi:hypothetical protein NIES2101_39845 [Calothrix sp. HK-06]|nr:hypothetical protein NIES2101_39845 [Calothrix sp. HK-06]
MKQIRTNKLDNQDKQTVNWYSWLFIKQIFLIFGAVLIGAFGYNEIIRQRYKVNRHQLPHAKFINSSAVEVINTLKVSAIKSNPIIKTKNFEVTYNILQSPNFNKSQKLDKIVNAVVNLTKYQELPLEPLSVTLINIKTKTISGYHQHVPKYPASVVKLFWMVILEQYHNLYIIEKNNDSHNDLKDMILKSDNDAASRIIDTITGTKTSLNELNESKLATWLFQRYQVNRFFEKAGYKGINISQKTYPVAEPIMNEPQGTELQLQNSQTTGNRISTYHAARLMYEIVTNRAVSAPSSQKMLTLLKRDLNISTWKNNPPPTEGFNAIDNFLGESLSDKDIIFASKAGQTSTGRQEVAYIGSKDGRIEYILAVFGCSREYSESNSIFPDISRLVFEQMR